MKRFLITVLLGSLFFPHHFPSFAEASDSVGFHSADTDTSGIFVKDRIPLQIVSGLLFSPTVLPCQTAGMDYWQTNMRIGWMLTDIYDKKSFLRGNFEALFELSYSYIYKVQGR